MVEIGGGNGFLAWLMNHASEASFILMFGGMSLFFILEPVFPRRENKSPTGHRWLSNIILAIINFAVITMATIWLSNFLIEMEWHFSWLQTLGLPLWFSVVIGVMVMEFLGYWLHRAMHGFPLLWRIHMIHHSDPEMDVTTAYRHHPFESIVAMIFVTPLTLLLGAPVEAALLYNGLHILLALSSHANIKTPEKLDALLRPFIITPDFHRMHHISQRRYTDSNYGAVFPWFDYLFRTATQIPYEGIPQQEIGLEKWRSSSVNSLRNLLLLPFRNV